MQKTINKIFWITHPAAAVNAREKEKIMPASQMQQFVEQNFFPIIRKAKAEPNSIVVLVKSFSFSPGAFGELPGFSIARQRQMNSIEQNLARKIVSELGKRGIVSENPFMETAVPAIIREINKRNFVVLKKARIKGFGAYREISAQRFPNFFAMQMRLAKEPVVQKKGTVSFEKKFRRRK